jgi:aminopeptidase N
MTLRTILLCFLCVWAIALHAQMWKAFPEHTELAGCARKTLAPGGTNGPTLMATAPEVDALYYLLDLRLAVAPPLLIGRVVLRARVTADSLPVLVVDLSSPMVVDSVRSNGRVLPVTRYTWAFSVPLSPPPKRGTEVEIETFYHGVPVPTGFGSFAFSSTSGNPWIWSLSEPYGARDWWPCIDEPADKADSVDIWVTCPATLKVGSNGRLAEVRDNHDGTRTHEWAERYPISTYLVSLAAGPYVEFSNWYHYSPGDSMQVLNYVLPGRLQEALTTLPKTVDMLGIFSGLFGAYPFLREKYGHSEFGQGGAMEHQTMTSTITFNEDVIAHELAHQWFGDLITCASWQHLWLNEGFATYSEALYREARYGISEYWKLMDARMSSAFNAQGTLFVADTSSVASLFAVSRVYAKGASVLHMLRRVVGDTTFFRALRAYATDPRFRYANATTEDFQRTCERVSGRDLSWFFSQWVYGEGYPRYFVRWSSSTEGSSSRVTLRIQQKATTSNPLSFVMPIDCRVSNATRDTTFVIWNDRIDQEIVIQAGFVPTKVELDPDRWILREVLDANSPLPETYILDPAFPNPFNQATTITVRMPKRASATLAVYSVLGELVRTIVDGTLEPGIHTYEWNGQTNAGPPAASGLYFCRLRIDGFVATQRMILLR